MKALIAGLSRNSFVHVGVAFLAMGGWAFFANSAHPMPAPMLAGVVQGGLSATITLLLKRIVEALAARFRGNAALLAPPAIACTISASLLTLIHWLAGTPELLATIAVPLTVATSYAAIYNYALWKSGRG